MSRDWSWYWGRWFSLIVRGDEVSGEGGENFDWDAIIWNFVAEGEVFVELSSH